MAGYAPLNTRDRGYKLSDSTALNNAMPDGWYDDPATPNMERWWNGTDWTDHVRYTDKVRPHPAASQVPALSIVEPSQAAIGSNWLDRQAAIRPHLTIAEPSVPAFTPSPAFSPFDAPTFDEPTSTGPAFDVQPSFGGSSFGAPSFGAPSFGGSSFSSSTFSAPSVSAPSIGAPSFSAPSYSAPAYSAPAIAAPSFGALSISAPAFDAPALGAPSFGAPASTGPVFTNPVPESAAWSAPTDPASNFDDFYVPMRQGAPLAVYAKSPKRSKGNAAVIWISALAIIGAAVGAGLWMFLPR